MSDQPAASPATSLALSARGRRLRGLAVNLALGVGSLAFVLVGGEIALRFAGFQPRGTWSAPCYEPLPEIR